MLPTLLPILGEVGFSVEEFGKGTFSIRAIPVILGKNLDREGVRDLLSTILSGDMPEGPSDRERVLKLIACRGAIKGGTPCTAEQCTTLIGQLRRTAHPFSCPHGRPTMVTFTKKDLDHLFLRT
jgi:DNA mismatch repair protein MutL